MMAKVKCTLSFTYPSEEDAEKLLMALKVDDGGYIQTKREGKGLLAQAEAETLPSLMHTLNDFMACLTAAEKLMGLGKSD